MIRLFNTFVIIFIFGYSCLSQFKELNNEWLKIDEKYCKIQISKEGIYRIKKNELPVYFQELDPTKFKLIYRGKYLPLNVVGESNGNFEIEFYGKPNDGAFDDLVYSSPQKKANRFVSLFSNVAAYFLIYHHESLIENKLKVEPNNLDGLQNNVNSFYLRNISRGFEDEWNYDQQTNFINQLSNSYFEPNETILSNRYFFKADTQYVEKIPLENYKTKENYPIIYNVGLAGRNASNRTLSLNVGNFIQEFQINNFDLKEVNISIKEYNSNNLPIKINFVKTNSSSLLEGLQYDAFSLLGYEINYPSSPEFITDSPIILPKSDKLYNSIILDNSIGNFTAYDITDFYKQSKLIYKFDENSKKSTITTLSSDTPNKIWLSSQFLTPLKIVEYKYTEGENFNYLIITDSSLKEGANEYKNYRESKEGGNYKVKIISSEEIYNQFSFGEKNPIAIKAFLNHSLKKNNIEYLLLLGRPLSQPVLSKKSPELDLVSSIGFPASDILHSAGLNSFNKDLQSIPTGRISVTSNSEIQVYLNKVKEFESNISKRSSFNKNFLHLSGGKGEFQVLEFKNFLNGLGQIAMKSKLGADYISLYKTKVNDGTQPVDISNIVNNGVNFITFFGHSSVSALDLNIGYASDEKSGLKNSPNYPFMFFNGCGAGNIFGRLTNSLSRDWILAPSKGAIAILAHSSLSYSNSNNIYMTRFYETYFSTNEMINSPIGKIIQKTNESILNDYKNDQFLIANVHQMILQGDPAIRIFNMTKPDFQTEDSKLFLTSTLKNKAVADGDSLKLGVMITNYGIYEAGTTLNLNLKKTYTDGKTTNQIVKIKAVAYQDTVLVSLKKDLNLKSVSIFVDNDLKVDEMDETNNTGTINFNWEALKNTAYYSTATLVDIVNPNLEVKLEGKLPVNGMEAAQNSILEIDLTDENSFGNKADKLEVSYRKLCATCPETLTKLDLGAISGEPNEIKAAINLKGLSPGVYEIFIQGYDAKKNSSGDVFTFTFNILDETKATEVKVYPNPMSLYTTFEIAVSHKNSLTKANYNINIYNQMGVFVKAINGDLKLGLNNVYWDAKDISGNMVPGGQYFYKMIINKDGEVENKGGKIRIFP